MTVEHAERPAASASRWWFARTGRLVFVVVGMILVIVANLSLRERHKEQMVPAAGSPEAADLVVGECVVVNAVEKTADGGIRRSDCAADPSYTVGAVYAGDRECDGPNYADHAWTVGGEPARRACLVQNLASGHCYRLSPATAILEQIDCAAASSPGEFKVIGRTDSLNAGPCPDGVIAYTYPMPPRTYCLASASTGVVAP